MKKEELDRFSRLSGVRLTIPKDITELLDTIICEKEDGKDENLPDWTDEFYHSEVIRNITYLSYMEKITDSYMLKLNSGPLINDIKTFFRMSPESSPVKFKVYSGHDITLLPLVYAFDVHPRISRIPTFTDTMAFEWYRGSDGSEDQVKVSKVSSL